MVVGIDVHKRAHVAALLDERGGELGTFGFANSPEGMRRLCAWLVAHDASEAVVGVESPAGYGRLLVASLEAAGHEVLNVPAWRTHRERRRHGPGKTDPGDAIAVAQVVLRKRAELGPALESELVRALALLELQRLKRISFGEGLVEQVATGCIRDLARDIEDLNQRIAALDKQIAQLLTEHGNPVGDLHGAGTQIAAALIAHAGDVRRFRDAAAFARFCGAAPIPCGSGQTAGRHRLHRGGNRQLNAALYRIAIVQARHHPPARTYLARKIAEGKTPREARRALKRHLANVIYRRLYAWAEATPALNP